MRRVLAVTAVLALLVLAWLAGAERARHTTRATRPAREAEAETSRAPGPSEVDAPHTPRPSTSNGGTTVVTTPVPEKTWRVRLVTTSNRPIPGVVVRFVDGDNGWVGRSVTGEDGWAECATSRKVHRIVAPPFVESSRVGETQTVVRLPVLPLEVVFRDVMTGAILPGGQVELIHEGYRQSIPRGGDGFRTSLAPVVPERQASFRLRVLAPEGHSGPTDVVVSEEVSRMATKMRVEVPVGPEIRYRLQVVDADGYPVEGARAEVFMQVPRSMTILSEPSDRLGRIELRRLPYFPRQANVRVEVPGDAPGPVVLTSSFALTRDLGDPVTVRLDPVAVLRADVGMKAEEPEEVEDEERYDPPVRGSRRLEVQCVRANGNAAVGVRVHLWGDAWCWHAVAFTDARGVAVFEPLPDEECSAEVCDAGFRSPTLSIDPSATRAELREPAGRRITVRATGRDGQPLQLLQLRSGLVRVVDGVQVTGTFTNLEGVAHLLGVPTGELEIETERGRIQVPEGVDTCKVSFR